MSESENQRIEKQPRRVYVYMPKYSVWVISDCDDIGLTQAMNAVSAKMQLKPVPGKQNTCHRNWVVKAEAFEAVRRLLDELGYRDIRDAQTDGPSASFQVGQKSATEPISQERTYSVPELTREIKGALTAAFPARIWVKGEISGLKSPNPHVYFDLIDGSVKAKMPEKIKAVIWADAWRAFKEKIQSGRLPNIENGVEIRAAGTLNYYGAGSQVTLYIQEIDESFAIGEFFRRKAVIEEQLKAAGLHDRNLMLPMPVLPLKLAVFSNESAAGWKDFCAELNKCGFPFRITLFSVGLQGNQLESSFLKAFECLDRIGCDQFDLGIIIRGGGGVVELSGFNSLPIAQHVARSPLKFLIGIGHEEDRTVLDEIALRQKTPTAVAQLLCMLLGEQELKLQEAQKNIRLHSERILSDARSMLQQQSMKCANLLSEKRLNAVRRLETLRSALKTASAQRCHAAETELHDVVTSIRLVKQHQLECRNAELNEVRNRIFLVTTEACSGQARALERVTCDLRNNVSLRIHAENAQLAQQAALVCERTRSTKQSLQDTLNQYREKVELLNPQRLLERGFVVVRKTSGERISSIQDVSEKDKLTIRLVDGHVDVTVKKVRE